MYTLLLCIMCITLHFGNILQIAVVESNKEMCPITYFNVEMCCQSLEGSENSLAEVQKYWFLKVFEPLPFNQSENRKDFYLIRTFFYSILMYCFFIMRTT